MTTHSRIQSMPVQLVNQIAASEGISFKEARSKVDQFVLSVVEQLKNGGSFTFENIGTIHYDKEENIVFSNPSFLSDRRINILVKSAL